MARLLTQQFASLVFDGADPRARCRPGSCSRAEDLTTTLAGLYGVHLLFNAPLAVFTGNLSKTWRRGVFEYGALADEFGRQFESRWLAREAGVNKGILERSDFSAATDLY